MKKSAQFSFKIHRYDPESGASSTEEYKVPADAELTVLDAINLIKNRQEPALAYRWSCRMGICGSCGAIVNGKPVLMCSTFCRDLEQPIVITPMKNFPVVKDLVVDTDDAMNKFRTSLPYFDRAKAKTKPDDEYLQTPEQMEKFKQTSQCIKCMLCYSACPVFGLDKKFTGPAAGALAYRYHKDSRDTAKEQRLDSVAGPDGIYDCSFVGECSVVCPKSVDPALALQKLKVMGVLHIAKSFIKKRRKKNPAK